MEASEQNPLLFRWAGHRPGAVYYHPGRRPQPTTRSQPQIKKRCTPRCTCCLFGKSEPPPSPSPNPVLDRNVYITATSLGSYRGQPWYGASSLITRTVSTSRMEPGASRHDHHAAPKEQRDRDKVIRGGRCAVRGFTAGCHRRQTCYTLAMRATRSWSGRRSAPRFGRRRRRSSYGLLDESI